MDIGKAFSYVFEDKQWPAKILLGGVFILLSFLIFPFLFVLGYFAQTIKNASEGVEPLLPEWTDYGDKLAKGFSIVVIYVLYELPIFILLIVYSIIAASLATVSQGGESGVGSLIAILGLLVTIAIFIYSIFLFLALPVATIKYSVSGSIGQAFRLGEIWSVIKNNIGSLIVVLLLTYVAGIIGSLGVIALFIGVAFTSFYALAVVGSLYGQFIRQATGKITVKAA